MTDQADTPDPIARWNRAAEKATWCHDACCASFWSRAEAAEVVRAGAALVAELAAARDREAALRSALERTQTNFIDAVRGNPVRGMAENLAENAAALGASVQSEQPTRTAE